LPLNAGDEGHDHGADPLRISTIVKNSCLICEKTIHEGTRWPRISGHQTALYLALVQELLALPDADRQADRPPPGLGVM
jgi:hypothetical protein